MSTELQALSFSGFNRLDHVIWFRAQDVSIPPEFCHVNLNIYESADCMSGSGAICQLLDNFQSTLCVAHGLKRTQVHFKVADTVVKSSGSVREWVATNHSNSGNSGVEYGRINWNRGRGQLTLKLCSVEVTECVLRSGNWQFENDGLFEKTNASFSRGLPEAISVLLTRKLKVEISSGNKRWSFSHKRPPQCKVGSLCVHIENLSRKAAETTVSIGNVSEKDFRAEHVLWLPPYHVRRIRGSECAGGSLIHSGRRARGACRKEAEKSEESSEGELQNGYDGRVFVDGILTLHRPLVFGINVDSESNNVRLTAERGGLVNEKGTLVKVVCEIWEQMLQYETRTAASKRQHSKRLVRHLVGKCETIEHEMLGKMSNSGAKLVFAAFQTCFRGAQAFLEGDEREAFGITQVLKQNGVAISGALHGLFSKHGCIESVDTMQRRELERCQPGSLLYGGALAKVCTLICRHIWDCVDVRFMCGMSSAAYVQYTDKHTANDGISLVRVFVDERVIKGNAEVEEGLRVVGVIERAAMVAERTEDGREYVRERVRTFLGSNGLKGVVESKAEVAAREAVTWCSEIESKWRCGMVVGESKDRVVREKRKATPTLPVVKQAWVRSKRAATGAGVSRRTVARGRTYDALTMTQ